MAQPVGIGVVGTGGRDQLLDVGAEPLVEEHRSLIVERIAMMRSFDISAFNRTCLKSKLTSLASSSGGR